jgi:hypothetical protein
MNTPSGDLEKRFTEVYRKGLWGGQKSGPGSTVEATRAHRREIAALLGDLFPPGSKQTLVDAACGDMAWMPLLLEELVAKKGCRLKYVGVDIVKELIERNSEACVSTGKIEYRFLHRDLTQFPPPRGDVIFCKDLVNHLVFDDIDRLLAGFSRSGSTWLLITSNEGHRNFNAEKMEGNASRHINLETAPFHLPKPQWSNGYLSLWRLPL